MRNGLACPCKNFLIIYQMKKTYKRTEDYKKERKKK